MFDTKISVYGIFIIVSVLSGLYVFYKNAKILNLKKDKLTALMIYIILGLIFGAKYFTFFASPLKNYKNFDFIKIGFSSYGAIIGIILLLFLFSKQYKISFRDLIYVMLPSIPLMYGIGKIGCFLVGCCYGIEYEGPFSVTYNYSYPLIKGINLFPVQLLETIVFLGIFVYVFYKVKNNRPSNTIIGYTFIICGISKFLLDYLRMSHVNVIISINQVISILFILIGICLILQFYYKKYFRYKVKLK